jgi:hypothetical protein
MYFEKLSRSSFSTVSPPPGFRTEAVYGFAPLFRFKLQYMPPLRLHPRRQEKERKININDALSPPAPSHIVPRATGGAVGFLATFQRWAIDGTHIPVIVAWKDKIKYTNRKGYTSQDVIKICNFDMRFTFAVSGWPGSVHDTRVWTDARPRFPNYLHSPLGNPFAYLVWTHNIRS